MRPATMLGFVCSPGAKPHPPHFVRMPNRPAQAVGQLKRISRFDQQTCDTILDQFRQGSDPARDHWRAGRIRLED